MFEYAKLHCLVVIIITAALGLFVDRSVPYFPIEISRTCTGFYAQNFFRYGCVTIGLTALYMDKDSLSTSLSSPLYVWIAVVIIAFFNDKQYFTIHCAAVLLMLGMVAANVFFTGDVQRKFPLFVCACLLMGASVAIKSIMIIYTEHEVKLDDWHVWWRILSNQNGFTEQVVEHTMSVMYKVDGVLVPSLTLPAFRMTGVLQWMSFYLMSALY